MLKQISFLLFNVRTARQILPFLRLKSILCEKDTTPSPVDILSIEWGFSKVWQSDKRSSFPNGNRNNDKYKSNTRISSEKYNPIDYAWVEHKQRSNHWNQSLCHSASCKFEDFILRVRLFPRLCSNQRCARHGVILRRLVETDKFLDILNIQSKEETSKIISDPPHLPPLH